jgi:uncharacterized membrane protein
VDTYRLLAFAHVAGLLLFLFAHGASAFVMLRVRREGDPGRLAALLDLSKDAQAPLRLGMAVMGVSGFWLAWEGGFLKAGWVWASVGVFVLASAVMGFLGTRYFEGLRELLAASDRKALDARRERSLAWLLAAFGSASILVLLWLMMYKPF